MDEQALDDILDSTNEDYMWSSFNNDDDLTMDPLEFSEWDDFSNPADDLFDSIGEAYALTSQN